MNHVISFHRPGQTDVLTTLSVPPHEEVISYVRRLENRGYKVIDITPPIDQQGPPQRPQPPELKVVNPATPSLRTTPPSH